MELEKLTLLTGSCLAKSVVMDRRIHRSKMSALPTLSKGKYWEYCDLLERRVQW